MIQFPAPFGRYLLVEKLATGGMAEIFRAKLQGVEGFEKFLVIKRILPFWSERQDFIHMLVDEAKVLVHLNHPNIVQIFELGRVGETYFIAMEYVAGVDLRGLLKATQAGGGELPTEVAVSIMIRVLEGLSYAHGRHLPDQGFLGIVHRDISPQNILVGVDGAVKVTDFGIAKAVTQTHETQTGVLKGKYAYMSPEQALGRPLDARSDLYSCGIVLFEMLSGHRPFQGQNDLEILDRVRQAEISFTSLRRKHVSEALLQVLDRALQKAPEKRFASAEAFAHALEACLPGKKAWSGKRLAVFFREVLGDPRPGEKLGAGETTDKETPAPRATRVTPSDSQATVSLVVPETLLSPVTRPEEFFPPPTKTSSWWRRNLLILLAALWLAGAGVFSYFMIPRWFGGESKFTEAGGVKLWAMVRQPPAPIGQAPSPSPLPLPVPKGQLSLTTQPPSAQLLVEFGEERREGKGSLELQDLPVDQEILIMAQQKGFEKFEKKLKIQPEHPHVSYEVKLKPLPPKLGSLQVNAVPWGKVSLQGFFSGRETPVRRGGIPEGRYRVSVSNPVLGKTVGTTAQIRGGRTTRCQVDFEGKAQLRCR